MSIALSFYEGPVLTLNVICSLLNECKWQIRMMRCSQILPTWVMGEFTAEAQIGAIYHRVTRE